MNLRDLSYWLAVAEHKHFGKAAASCFVSQPALSAQLKKLEQELGVQLFERTNKQVLITEVGAELLVQAQKILQEVDRLKIMATAAQDPLAGNYRLGVIPTIGPYLLPHILTDVKRKLPNLQLLIQEERTGQCLELLQQGKLDAAILAETEETANFASFSLYHERFVVALPLQHPLNKKKRLSLEDLDHEKVMLLEEGHCLRDQALDICHRAGMEEDSSLRATSLETLRYMVSLNNGITLLPELASKGVFSKQAKIELRPLVTPEPSRHIILITRMQSVRVASDEALSSLIQEAYQRVA